MFTVVDTPSFNLLVLRHVTKTKRKEIFHINIIGLQIPTDGRKEEQLAVYKHDQGGELVSTEKQLQLCGQSGT